MYFKKLEIVGFKSFLNKTKLKFEPGVTAVVGPNGCGKSNIVDAIKWVLGEQSTKSMRSSSMQDVIFNGTDKYEPVNFAEVALTFSNEDRSLPVDFDEVTISRRLYRSGESEYILNKTPVRLMDIKNILMGTGIGTSSYSIVEQGRMDMILSSKPEDRRYVFEEASGITRYKTKKREALMKLEKTRDNLLRINDIIREVERQINSIERKARKAERYKARFEQLKTLEVKLSVKKYRELSTDDTSLVDKNRQIRETSEELARKVEEMSAMLLNARGEFNSLSEDLNNSQNEVMRLSTDIDKNRHTIEVNRERVEELRKQVERFDWEIEQATERKDSMKTRLDELEERFRDVSGRRQNKEEALSAAEDNIKAVTSSLETHRHELKMNREKIVDIVSEETRTKNALIKNGADIQNALSRERRLKLERNNVQAEKDNVAEKMRGIEEELVLATAGFGEKKDEYRVFSDEYVARQQRQALLVSDRAEKEKHLNRIKPRREFLEKLISEREGMGESVKDIMKRAESGDPRFSGVKGILSEIINVRESYEESVKSVLGDASHALVVDSRDTADRVIGYLAENAMESVNLIILGDIQKFLSGGDSPVVSGNSPLGGISEVITAREPYDTAIREFFSDILVTVSFETARSFLDSQPSFGGRIIGERGEVYQKGIFRSRNFSSKETIPLFGRREKLEQMKQEESSVEEAVRELTVSIDQLEEWFKASLSKKESLEAELREREMRLAEVSSRKSSVKEKMDSINEEVLILEAEIEEERDVLRQLNEDKERYEQTFVEVEKRQRELQESIDRAQEEIRENSVRREETLFCMSDLKAELSAMRKEEENLADNLERERRSFQRVDSDVEERRARIDESGQRIRDLEEETVCLEGHNVELNSALEERNAEIFEKKERKDALAVRINRAQEELRSCEQELESARDKARDVDIMKKEIEFKRASIVEKMMDSYKVDISSVEVEIDPGADWDGVLSQIKDIKEQLERMGDVSLGAMEEHKQLEERFGFLSKQREDLESAREQLMQAIQKINRTTKKKFMESFEAIKKEFNDYFRMLFNGGKADLVLEDENNVLECGIDIVVRPPGKKLHNIMQLSGGEKAMTAIALIFAIFKVNPSPFCVLDEIDAPLDESNVVRFCRVLQEFLKLSQFVIITHNRMTIQLADVLYGITMEEKGVSKMVSVKFAEENEIKEKATVGAAV
jgi:chromosome segregation protein